MLQYILQVHALHRLVKYIVRNGPSNTKVKAAVNIHSKCFFHCIECVFLHHYQNENDPDSSHWNTFFAILSFYEQDIARLERMK